MFIVKNDTDAQCYMLKRRSVGDVASRDLGNDAFSTRAKARAFIAERHLEDVDLYSYRVINTAPLPPRQLTPKKYAVETRNPNSRHHEWERCSQPGTRQTARNYVADSKAHDERLRLVGWQYRVVEVVCG